MLIKWRLAELFSKVEGRDGVDAYAAGFRREMAQLIELLRGDESFSALLALQSGSEGRGRFAQGVREIWGVDAAVGAGIVDEVMGGRLDEM